MDFKQSDIPEFWTTDLTYIHYFDFGREIFQVDTNVLIEAILNILLD